MMIADTLGSYGSLARYKTLERIVKVSETTVVGAGGEYSDFQQLQKYFQDIAIEDFNEQDGARSPAELHSWLGRVMYNRRSKVNPLWNHVLLAGFDEGKSFLGAVDLYGTTYTDNYLSTGYGQYLAMPLIRKAWKPELSYEEAKQLLEDCQRVLIYRDCRTINSFLLSTVTKDGVQISKPYSIATKWDYKLFVNPNSAGVPNTVVSAQE